MSIAPRGVGTGKPQIVERSVDVVSGWLYTSAPGTVSKEVTLDFSDLNLTQPPIVFAAIKEAQLNSKSVYGAFNAQLNEYRITNVTQTTAQVTFYATSQYDGMYAKGTIEFIIIY